MFKNKKYHTLITVINMAFFFSAFVLLSMKELPYNFTALILAFTIPLIIGLIDIISLKTLHLDKLIVSLVNFLCALGILVLYSVDPPLGLKQCFNYIIGLFTMFILTYLITHIQLKTSLSYLLLFFTLLFISLPLFWGKEINGATNWIHIAGISIQPSEISKILFTILIAHFMGKDNPLPWLVLFIGSMVILMLQKDLGTALIYYILTLLLFFASSGNIFFTILGILGSILASIFGYKMFAHVKKRVAIWQNPWLDMLGDSYQIIQSLSAISSGALLGVGLGLGNPTKIPIYHSDMIFAVIVEQFGLIFSICVLGIYIVLTIKGYILSLKAKTNFLSLLAMGCTTALSFQTFLIVAGVIKLIPLTGVTMPFVSYGGSSLISSLGLIGVLQGINHLSNKSITSNNSL